MKRRYYLLIPIMMIVLFFSGFTLSYFFLNCPSGLCDDDVMGQNDMKEMIRGRIENGDIIPSIADSSYEGWEMKLSDTGWSQYGISGQGSFQVNTVWVLDVFCPGKVDKWTSPTSPISEERTLSFSIHVHPKFRTLQTEIFNDFVNGTAGDHKSPNYEIFLEYGTFTFIYASFFINGKIDY